MSSFLCSVNCLPQAWLLTGQAVRTAQDLGLHVSMMGILFIFPNLFLFTALSTSSHYYTDRQGNPAQNLVGCIFP